jgi:hypothetical protein
VVSPYDSRFVGQYNEEAIPVNDILRELVIPQLRGLESAGLPGMPSKILSSGCFEIFIGKGIHRHHKMIPCSVQGILWSEGEAKVTAIRFSPTPLPTGRP